MSKSNKKDLYKIIISSILFVIGVIFFESNYFWQLLLFIVSYLIIGGSVLSKAIRNILNGQVFDENFLMGVATLGAFIIGEYAEGLAVMLFYQVGELFQSYAVGKSRKSITSLMDIRPDYANIDNNGELIKVDPDDIKVGDLIVVKPGERIPLDGIVVEGVSSIDTSALTGETIPHDVKEDSEVLSGCININGLLTVKVLKEFHESTVSRILDLVENASDKKSEPEKFITKFARYYTPIVVVGALLLAIIPPILIKDNTFNIWSYRALSFLVISCPCALVISVPLSFFGGIGATAKQGILVKGSNYLETLAKVTTVVFDKTGTLTKGVFEVQQINACNIDEESLLKYAAYAESYSTHPIALALINAYGLIIDKNSIKEVEEIPGHGLKALIEDKEVMVGNTKLLEKYEIDYKKEQTVGTVVYVVVNKKYIGNIVINDEIKDDSKSTIKKLKQNKINQTIMLTGDRKVVAENVAKKLELDQVYSELLPIDKVAIVEQLLNDKKQEEMIAFVGDGINDAPVLARADVGIAMGGLGSDAAIEAADIVIMNDQPSKIITAISIAKKTIGIAKQNIIFTLIVKVLVLIFGALGYASMWVAVFADVGVSIIAILNAIRILKE